MGVQKAVEGFDGKGQGMHLRFSRRTFLNQSLVGFAAALPLWACDSGSPGALAQAAPHPFRNPYQRRRADAPLNYACSTAPAPARDLTVDNPYKANDYGKRDETAFAKTRDQIDGVAKFASLVSNASDAMLLGSDEEQRAAAACLTPALSDWANARALMGELNRAAQYERTKLLATVALSLLKGDAGMGYAAPVDVHRWVAAMSTTLPLIYKGESQNNLYYWAALAACAAAVLLEDKAQFQWSTAIFDGALAAVTPDGYLPLELDRKEGALAYHNYALAPLVMQAFILSANGRSAQDLGLAPGGALRRLADTTLAGLDDVGKFAARAGAPQAESRSRWDDTNMAWLPTYLRLTQDPAASAWATRLKRPRSIWLGGLA
jgi:poly(beta-D-mannuronate) lyase